MTRRAAYLLAATTPLVILPTPAPAQRTEALAETPSIKTLAPISILEFKPAFRYTDPAKGPFTDRNIHFASALPDVIDGTRIVDAWAPGYLPVTLYLSNGTCLLYSVNRGSYGPVSGRLEPTACAERRAEDRRAPPYPVPAGLRFVGTSWGMSAWVRDEDGTTVVTKPHAKTFTPLFTANFPVLAMTAIIDPHGVGADMTLIGRRNGRLVAVMIGVGVR